jgi:hypothetical protein
MSDYSETNRAFRGVWIPRHIWLHPGLSIIEKCMLVEIDSLSKLDGGCYASNAHFASFLGVSASRASEIVMALKTAGLIDTEIGWDDKKQRCRKITMTGRVSVNTDDEVSGNGGEGYSENRRGGIRETDENNTKNNNTKEQYQTLLGDEEKSKPKTPDEDPEFDAFWAAYPRKIDRKDALKAWGRAIKRAKPPTIMAGLAAYSFSEEEKFRPHPATWLNNDRWVVEDVPVPRAAPIAPDLAADPWGVNAWIATLNLTERCTVDGVKVPSLNLMSPAFECERVCEIAGIPRTARPKLDALMGWIRDDLDLGTRGVMNAIREAARTARGPIGSLAYFDQPIRAVARHNGDLDMYAPAEDRVKREEWGG